MNPDPDGPRKINLEAPRLFHAGKREAGHCLLTSYRGFGGAFPVRTSSPEIHTPSIV